MEAQIVKTIHDLQTEINTYDLMYHVFKEPIVQDDFYDQQKNTLYRIVKENPYLANVLPKARSIAEQIATNRRITRHDFPMLEFRETNDLHGLRRWFELVEAESIVVEPYYVGCEVELVYVGGNLHKAVTRGDGLEGKDITLDMYSVSGVPQTISEMERVNIHGRVIISKRNISLTAGFENSPPMMVVAHHLMQRYPEAIAESEPEILQFVPHTVNIPGMPFDLMQLRAILASWEFDVPDAVVMKGKCSDVSVIEDVIVELEAKQLADDSFAIDGLLFKVNETQKRLELGYTSRYPEWVVNYIKGKSNVGSKAPN